MKTCLIIFSLISNLTFLVAQEEKSQKQSYKMCFIGDTGVAPKKVNRSFNEELKNQKIATDKIATEGCDRIHILGDILYDNGLTGYDDPEFIRQFYAPYKKAIEAGAKMVITIGNHDIMFDPSAWDSYADGSSKAKFPDIKKIVGLSEDPEYIKKMSPKKSSGLYPNIVFPGYYFEEIHTEGPLKGLCLAGIESSSFWPTQVKLQRFFTKGDKDSVNNLFDFGHFPDLRAHQRRWMTDFNKRTESCELKIAVSHHPYKSVGDHGDAGEGTIPWGKKYKEFSETHLRGKFDFVFSGHDHHLSYEGEYYCISNECEESCEECDEDGETKDCNACRSCSLNACEEKKANRATHFIVAGGGAAIRDLDKEAEDDMEDKIDNGMRLFGKKALGYAVLEIPEGQVKKAKLYFRYYDMKSGTWNVWNK